MAESEPVRTGAFWLISDESGREEVYVRSFPDGASRWTASVNGGTQPRWSGEGKELCYVEDNALMAVPASTEPGFTLGQPQKLSRPPL